MRIIIDSIKSNVPENLYIDDKTRSIVIEFHSEREDVCGSISFRISEDEFMSMTIADVREKVVEYLRKVR